MHGSEIAERESIIKGLRERLADAKRAAERISDSRKRGLALQKLERAENGISDAEKSISDGGFAFVNGMINANREMTETSEQYFK
ncbi:MAG: hypothetical protein AAB573_04310 [Patescibacteria group bacterium]